MEVAMTLEASLKQLVAEAVREALDQAIPEHLEARRAAHEPSRLLAEALAGGDSEELAELRRVNALDYLDANDAAKLLGIGRHQVYRLVRSGELKSTKVGNKLILRRSDIDEAFSRGGVLVTESMPRATRQGFKAGR